MIVIRPASGAFFGPHPISGKFLLAALSKLSGGRPSAQHRRNFSHRIRALRYLWRKGEARNHTLGRFSGYASYSNMRGNGYFPVTGGLFLGDEAVQAISATSGVFPVSQDQRNTVRARFRYEVTPRIWVAVGGTYDSGLPIDFDGTYQEAEMQYGQAILNRVNFSDYRPRPLFSLNASLGITLRKNEKYPVRFQIDGTNLTNEINVIDFAGLFSGTAIGPPRSVNARLQFGF